jgi:hypothetical protein
MKKPEAQPRNLLTLRPRPLRGAEEDAAGNLVVLIPRFGNGRMGRWLMGRAKHKYHRLSLDEVGTHVWRRCDGRTTVESIAASLRERFGDKVEPVYDRLGLFINQMLRARLIELPDDERSAAHEQG